MWKGGGKMFADDQRQYRIAEKFQPLVLLTIPGAPLVAIRFMCERLLQEMGTLEPISQQALHRLN
jgi:hypothetical protein